MNQICKARRSDSQDFGQCNVYGCRNDSLILLEVGGGFDSKTGTITQTRLCKVHSEAMRQSLHQVIVEIESK